MSGLRKKVLEFCWLPLASATAVQVLFVIECRQCQAIPTEVSSRRLRFVRQSGDCRHTCECERRHRFAIVTGPLRGARVRRRCGVVMPTAGCTLRRPLLSQPQLECSVMSGRTHVSVRVTVCDCVCVCMCVCVRVCIGVCMCICASWWMAGAALAVAPTRATVFEHVLHRGPATRTRPAVTLLQRGARRWCTPRTR